jgi:hypothetical protein
MAEPVLDGDRPYFPEICVIMDHKVNQCLEMEMIPPTQDRAIVLRDLAIKTINKTSETPQTIIIEEMEQELLKTVILIRRPENLFKLKI